MVMSGILYKRLDEVVYTVFDFETTGLSYDNGDKVVELAFVKYSYKHGIIDEFSSLVNPQRSIPFEATNVHGIYDSDVVNAPIFATFKNRILNFIDGAILVGHNVYFDLRFLKGEMSELGVILDIPHICTMGFPGFIGGQTRQKLNSICISKGITLSNSHSALGDTKATVELLKQHISDAQKSNFFIFNDLKSTKRSYKFISSWKAELPKLQYTNEDFENIPIVNRTNRTTNTKCFTSNYYNDNLLFKDCSEHEESFSNVNSKKSEGCYIATAVYGNYDNPEVIILRRFRDRILTKNILGRIIISCYYFVSPSIAKKLNGKLVLNYLIKLILDFFVHFIKHIFLTSPAGKKSILQNNKKT